MALYGGCLDFSQGQFTGLAARLGWREMISKGIASALVAFFFSLFKKVSFFIELMMQEEHDGTRREETPENTSFSLLWAR